MTNDLMPEEIWARLNDRGDDWCLNPLFGTKYIRADKVEGLVRALEVISLYDNNVEGRTAQEALAAFRKEGV